MRLSSGGFHRASAMLAPVLRFASTQGLVQLFGFVAGILVVRNLEKVEYAHYAIIVALIASMTLVSESGVSSVLLSQGARVGSDASRLSSLFGGALRFRRLFGSIVLVFGNIGMALLLLQNGASWSEIVTYSIIVTATSFQLFGKGVAQARLRLMSDFRTIQRVAFGSAAGRTLLIALFVMTTQLSVTALLLIGLCATTFESTRTRRVGFADLDRAAPHLFEDRRAFGSAVRQTLPMNLLLVLQTQLLYFLLGSAGSTETLAEIAALSRFAIVFVILNSVVADIGSGLVARTLNSRGALLRITGRIMGAYVAVAALFVLVAWLAAPWLVLLLGPSYEGLEGPLVVVAAGSAAINSMNALTSINQARGWIKWSWLYVPFAGLWMILGFLVLDLTDIYQAALLMAAQAVPSLVTQIVCFVAGVKLSQRSK
jgi:hypothetical protein